jgi:hypothetical protein
VCRHYAWRTEENRKQENKRKQKKTEELAFSKNYTMKTDFQFFSLVNVGFFMIARKIKAAEEKLTGTVGCGKSAAVNFWAMLFLF